VNFSHILKFEILGLTSRDAPTLTSLSQTTIVGAHCGAGVKIETLRSMVFTINTSCSESLFSSRQWHLYGRRRHPDGYLGTLTVDGGTSTVGGGTHTVGGGTRTVDGGTLTVTDGTRMVDDGTYTVNSGTLMATDGTQTIDDSAVAGMTWPCRHQAKQHPLVC
jgi:hypothetical protein